MLLRLPRVHINAAVMAPAGLVQARLQHVLEEIDPVDLSHVMWAMARFDSYPAPALVDEVLATLPPQITSAEPAVGGLVVQRPVFFMLLAPNVNVCISTAKYTGCVASHELSIRGLPCI